MNYIIDKETGLRFELKQGFCYVDVGRNQIICLPNEIFNVLGSIENRIWILNMEEDWVFDDEVTLDMCHFDDRTTHYKVTFL